jgi:hypothetical protein
MPSDNRSIARGPGKDERMLYGSRLANAAFEIARGAHEFKHVGDHQLRALISLSYANWRF